MIARLLAAALAAGMICTATAQADEPTEAEQLATMTRMLRALDDEFFCVCYGGALRDHTTLASPASAQVPIIAKAEAKRRKLRPDDAKVMASQITIGMNTCSLFAAWGTPGRRHRTVTATSERVQYVFGGTYVYTTNGLVTSWQD